MKNQLYKVLLIEDDKVDQLDFKRIVDAADLPYEYVIAPSVKEAERVLKSQKFDLILVDYRLGDGTAYDVVKFINNTPFIILTGTGSEQVAVDMLKSGAYDYLVKDIERNYLSILPLVIENAIIRHRADRRLELLSVAVMSARDSIYISDSNHNIILVNKAFCQTYSYREEEIIGKSSYDLWGDKPDASEIDDMTTQAISQGWSGEVRHKRKDGDLFPVLLSIAAVKDNDLNIIAFVSVSRDITSRIESEKALAASNASQRALLEGIPDGIFQIHRDGTILNFISSGNFETKIPPDEFLGNKLAEGLPQDVSRESMRLIDLTIKTGALQIHEYALRVNGDKRYYESRMVPYEEDQVLSIVRDVTSRVRAEMALEESEQRYRAVVEDQTEFISRYLPDGTITFVNDAFCRHVGKTRDDLIGKLWQSLVPKDIGEQLQERLASLNQANPVDHFETRIKTTEGDPVWEAWANRAIFDAQGQVVEYQGIGRNITERKQLEEARREQRIFAQTLAEIAATLNSSLYREEVLDIILLNLEKIIPYDSANIMLVESGIARIALARGYEKHGEENAAVLYELSFVVDELPDFVKNGVEQAATLHPGYSRIS